jgi:hypothetical protein
MLLLDPPTSGLIETADHLINRLSNNVGGVKLICAHSAADAEERAISL